MTKCYIIDDEQPAIKVIQNYITKFPELELIGTATNPLIGIDEIKKLKVDLLFLDIQMDEMNGIEVVKHIPKTVKIIFCTAYSEFAVESYNLDVIDYLMKPISFPRFEKAIYRRILKQNEFYNVNINNDYLFVKTEQKGKLIKIDFDDIDFIEGKSNYIGFHINKRVILSHNSLREMESFLPSNRFVRVHKSYIVALKKIASVENSEILLKNLNSKIPLSPNFKESFLQSLNGKLL